MIYPRICLELVLFWHFKTVLLTVDKHEHPTRCIVHTLRDTHHTQEVMIAKMLMKRIVPAVGESKRSPVLRRPDEYDMKYEDVSFSSEDGLPLEGWYIPSKKDSNKVVICNHFSPGNRYGYAGHIKPWKGAGGFEVNFLPKYKALSEAGYNVFAYDLRGHGMSTPGQNGAYNPKFFEYKDVIGSMNYIKSRPDTKDMDIHLHSMCLGGNSTLVAMRKRPDGSCRSQRVVPTHGRWPGFGAGTAPQIKFSASAPYALPSRKARRHPRPAFPWFHHQARQYSRSAPEPASAHP